MALESVFFSGVELGSLQLLLFSPDFGSEEDTTSLRVQD